MNDKDNVADILGELNRVLSNLTDGQREKVEDEFHNHESAKEPVIPAKQDLSAPPASLPTAGSMAAGPQPVFIEEEHIPEREFRLALFYPKGQKALTDVFISNITDVINKTTKKDFAIKGIIIEETDYTSFNAGAKIKKCADKVDAVFFITQDPLELDNEDSTIFCQNITVDKVNKRFLYVDFAVELMLVKKK